MNRSLRLVVAFSAFALVASQQPIHAADPIPTQMIRVAPADTHAASGDAHAAESHGGDGEEKLTVIGKPQEGLVVALTTLVIFIGLLLVLTKFAWGPIATGLKAREDKIRKDISDAELARAKADASLKEYQSQLAGAEAKVRELLNQATADAQKISQNMKMQAQQEIEEAKERSLRDIDAARDTALAEVYEQAATLSTSIAEKIIGRELNAADQQDLVRKSLEQLQTI